MELNEKVGSVKNREDLIRFIFHLRTDLQNKVQRFNKRVDYMKQFDVLKIKKITLLKVLPKGKLERF